MKKIIISYIIALIIFTLLEIFWLSQAAPHIYAPALSGIMASQPNAMGGLLFFLFYPAGILFFAMRYDGHGLADIGYALTRGGALGLIAYGTYSLTNLATLQGWTPLITLFDLGWGMTLSALTAVGSAAVMRKIYAPK